MQPAADCSYTLIPKLIKTIDACRRPRPIYYEGAQYICIIITHNSVSMRVHDRTVDNARVRALY